MCCDSRYFAADTYPKPNNGKQDFDYQKTCPAGFFGQYYLRTYRPHFISCGIRIKHPAIDGMGKVVTITSRGVDLKTRCPGDQDAHWQNNIRFDTLSRSLARVFFSVHVQLVSNFELMVGF